ncbi:MAG: ATP-binding cassette domain-containing protein [Proteobacteria bacterium]|nr:ATP-binding cassette domain-containing protein [Pseudomonadota bacterium]
MHPLILVENLFKSFGQGSKRVDVLKGISLTFNPGEAVAIYGSSGVGKTTFVHILGTLDKPTSGRVVYRGQDLFSMQERALAAFRNREIGFVFQLYYLLPEFTALENAMMPALIQGMQRKEAAMKAEQILVEVGLKDRITHKPGELSGGEQQRVALARALILQPTLLLADEPTGNLDATTGHAIHDLLMRLNSEKKVTLIVVTHNHEIANRMPKRIEMVDGKVLEET